MLKKILLFLAVILLAQPSTVYADTGQWARVVDEGVYLYVAEDAKQQLFQLELSYYVNIIDETPSMYQVAVMPQNSPDFVQVIGWVQKSKVSLCTAAPATPIYPTVKIAVTAESVDLKLSPLPSASTSCAILNLQQVSYYGAIASYGKTWYYVRYAGRFGYVESSSVSSPNISLHPTPLPQKPANSVPTTPPDATTTPETEEKSSPTSEILLIVFVVVLAVGLTLALFLPGNVKKKNNVFEQDI